MSPKVRFQILLEPVQLEALRKVEAKTGVPVARQIRMAVDRSLKGQGVLTAKRQRLKARKRS